MDGPAASGRASFEAPCTMLRTAQLAPQDDGLRVYTLDRRALRQLLLRFAVRKLLISDTLPSR
ncbi:hypothetical protein ACVWXO_007871 [Bradyrhizobium sp. LM2.7]